MLLQAGIYKMLRFYHNVLGTYTHTLRWKRKISYAYIYKSETKIKQDIKRELKLGKTTYIIE